MVRTLLLHKDTVSLLARHIGFYTRYVLCVPQETFKPVLTVELRLLPLRVPTLYRTGCFETSVTEIVAQRLVVIQRGIPHAVHSVPLVARLPPTFLLEANAVLLKEVGMPTCTEFRFIRAETCPAAVLTSEARSLAVPSSPCSDSRAGTPWQLPCRKLLSS